MPLTFVMHCPDEHLVYDGRTPDGEGVGGGVTARVRLAQALAGRGHDVEMICNARDAVTVAGVRYTPLAAAGARDCDVLIPVSSGGALSVAPVLKAGHRARLTLGWVHGLVPIQGFNDLQPDAIVCVSHFIASRFSENRTDPSTHVAVIHNGVDSAIAAEAGMHRRDPFRLIYSSHPSKGLAPAIGLLRLLRQTDSRYELHVYGGSRLWGQVEAAPEQESGVVYHGLVGQRQLAAAYWKSTFSVHLQTVEEAFGISLAEGKAARCVPIASPVGAIPELVTHAHDGLLIPGRPEAPDTLIAAAAAVQHAISGSGLQTMQRHAPDTVESWHKLAGEWERLVDELLSKRSRSKRLKALVAAAVSRSLAGALR